MWLILLIPMSWWVPLPAPGDRDAAILAAMLKSRYAMLAGDYERALELLNEAKETPHFAADAAYLEIEILFDRYDSKLSSSLRSRSELVETLRRHMKTFPEDYRFPMTMGGLLVRQPAMMVAYRLDDPGEYLKKATELMEALAEPPRTELADVYFSLGRWYMGSLRFFEAANAFEHTCRLEPDSEWAWYYAAQSSEASHQLSKALRYYDRFLKMGSRMPFGDRPPVQLVTAIIRLQLAPTETHFTALVEELRKEEMDPDAVFSAAAKLDKMDHTKMAVELIEMIPVNRRDSRHYQLLCQAALGSQAYSSLLPRVETWMNDPGISANARRALTAYAIQAAMLAGRYEEASALVNRFAEELRLTGALRLAGAFADFYHSGDKTAWESLSDAGLSEAQYRYWNDHADRFGFANTAHRFVLDLLMTWEDWSGALSHLRAVTDLEDPHPAFIESLAVIYAMSEDYDNSFRLYEQLILDHPEDISHKNNYGYFLSLAGRDLPKARELLEHVLKKDGDNPAYLDSMAWIHHKMGDQEAAIHYLSQALAKDETDPEQLEHMGDVLSAQGNLEEARRYWSLAMEHTSGRYSLILQKLDPYDPDTPMLPFGEPQR